MSTAFTSVRFFLLLLVCLKHGSHGAKSNLELDLQRAGIYKLQIFFVMCMRVSSEYMCTSFLSGAWEGSEKASDSPKERPGLQTTELSCITRGVFFEQS